MFSRNIGCGTYIFRKRWWGWGEGTNLLLSWKNVYLKKPFCSHTAKPNICLPPTTNMTQSPLLFPGYYMAKVCFPYGLKVANTSMFNIRGHV